MADHGFDLILVNQTVRDRDGLFRFTGVIALHQFDLLAINAARGVNVFRGLRRAVPVLISVGCVRPGEGARHANHDISLGGKRRHQTPCQHKRERTSDQFQRHYYVPFLSGFLHEPCVVERRRRTQSKTYYTKRTTYRRNRRDCLRMMILSTTVSKMVARTAAYCLCFDNFQYRAPF